MEEITKNCVETSGSELVSSEPIVNEPENSANSPPKITKKMFVLDPGRLKALGLDAKIKLALAKQNKKKSSTKSQKQLPDPQPPSTNFIEKKNPDKNKEIKIISVVNLDDPIKLDLLSNYSQQTNLIKGFSETNTFITPKKEPTIEILKDEIVDIQDSIKSPKLYRQLIESPKPKNMIYKTTDKNNKETVYKIYLTSISKKSANNNESPTKSPFKPPPDKQQITPVLSTIKKNTPNKPELQKKIIENFSKVFANTPVKFNETVDQDKNTKTSTPNCVIYKSQGGTLTPIKMVCKTPRVSSVKIISKQSPEIKSTGNFSKIDISKLKAKLNENLRKMSGTTPEKKIFEKSPIKSEMIESPKNSIDNVPKDAMERLNDYLKKIQEEKKISKQLIKKSIVNDVPKNSIAPISGISIIPKNKSSEGESSKTVKSTKYPYSIIKCSPKTKKQSKIRGLEISKDGEQFFGFMQKTIKESNQRSTGKLKIMKSLLKENQKELSETEWKIKIDKELNVSPRIEVNKGTKTYSRVPKKILTPVKIDDENSDFDFDDMPFESIDCNVVEYSNDNLIDQKNISIIIQSNNNVFDQTELKSNEESPKTKEITILEHIYEVKANESDSKINEESRTTKLEVIDVKETTFPEKNYEIKEIKANQSQVPEQICEEETVVHAIKEVESDLRLPIEDVILDPVKVIEEVPEPSKEPATSKKSFKQLDIRNCFKKSFKEKILHPQSSSKKPIEQEITEITPSSADSTKEDISPLQSSSIKPTKPSSPESLKGDEHVITKFVDSIFSRVEALEAVEAQNVSNNSSSLDAADSTEEYISPPQSSSIEQTMPEITEITYSSPESLNEDDLVITKFVDSIFSRVEALEAQNVSNNSSSLDAIIIKFVDDIFSKIESLELPDEINRKSIRGSKETESEDIVIEIKKSPVRRRSRRITEGKLSIEDISAVEQSLVDLGMLDETNKSSNSSEDIILEDIEKPKVEAQIPSKPRKGRFMVSNQALKRAGSLMKQPISVQEINHKNIDKEVNFPIEDKEVLKFDENTVKIVSNDEIKKSPIKFQNLHILKRLTRKPNVSNEALKRSGSSIKSNEQKLKEVPKEVVNEVLAIETTKIHNKDSGIVLSSESFNEDEEISIKTDLTSLEVPEKINISGRRSLRNRSIDENETKLHNLKVPSQNRTSRRRSRSLRNKSFVEEFKEESPTKRISRKSENSECHLKVQVNEKLSLKRNLRNSVGNNSEERQISKEVPIVDIPFNEMESENSRNISELESSETGTELESKVREYPENVVMIPPEATIETDKPKEDVKQKTPKRIGRKPIIPIKSTRSLRKSGVLNQEIIALQTEISPKVICSGVSETNLEEVSQKQDEIKSKPSKRIARKPIIPEKSSRSNSMTSVSMEGDFEGPSETFAVSVSEPEEKMSVLHSDPEIKTTVSALVLEAKLVPEPKEEVSEVNKSVQSLELEDKSVTKPNVNSIEKERSVELDKQTEVVNSVPEATRSEENQEEKNTKPSRRITRKPTIPVNSSRSSVSSIPKEEIALVQDETISIVTESEKLVEVKPKPFKRVTRKPIISEKSSRSSKKISSAPMALKVAENVIDVLPDSDSVLSESLEEKVSASTSPTKEEEEKEVANQIIKDVLPDSLPKQDNFVVPELHEEQQQTSSEQISKFPQEKIQEETAVPFSENQEVKKKSSKRGSRKPIIPQTNNRSSRKSVAPVSKENTLESEKEVPISEVQEVVNQSSDVFVATVTSIKRPKSPVVIENDLSLTHKADPICSTESLEEDEAVINECTDNICSRVEPLEVEVKSEIKVPDLEANIGEIQEEDLTSSSPVIIEESPSAEVVKEETKTKSSNRSARKSGKLIRDEEQISNNVVNTVAIEISNPTPENEERSETSKEITKTPPNKEQSELLKEQTNLMEEEHTEKDTVSVNGSEISVIAEIPIQNEDLEPENILETQKPKKRGRQKKNEDISLTPTTSKRNSRKSRVVYKENSDESETEVQTPNIARGRRTIRKDSTVIEQPKSAKRANRLSTASSISDIRDAPEIEEEFNGFVEGDEKLVVKTPSKRARSLSEETLKIEEVPRKKRAYNRKFPKPIVKDEDSNESKKLDDLIEETPKIEEVPRKKRAYNKKVPKPIVKDEDLNESKKLDDLIEETPKIEEVPIKKRAYNRKVPISIVKDEAKKRERTSGNLDDLNESKKQKVSSVVCGNCKETVPVKSWDSHLLRHNGIGWIVGEEEDWDINERNLILKKMLYFIKEKSLSFVTCEKCGITRKSALGLITHQEECGLDDEAVEKKKISCQYCGSRLKAYCLPIHLQNHCFELKRREKEAKEQQEAKDAEEIKTAVDKNVVLLTESGRVKRRSVLKAEHTIKKTTIREAKGSSEDYIGKFHRTKITGGCTRRWARQIKDTQIGKCLNVECSFTGKTVDALLSHSQICTFSDHGTGYICLICKKRHPLRESIKLHIEEVHRDTNEQGVAADYEPSGSEAEIEDESSDEDDDDDDDDTELGVEENDDFDGQDEDYVEEEGYGGGETRIRKQKLYNLPQIILENLEKSKMMMVDYKTILCNAKRTPFFSFAIDWTRQFRDLHYTIEPLYREIAIQQFNILTTEESKDFLPLVKKSPNFYAKVSEKYRSNYCNPKPPPEWQNLETFRGTSLGGVPTFYCGGPVTAMDWVPFPNSYKGPEVLAVVVKNDIHNATTIFDLQPKKCLIQIWDIPDVTNAVLRILSIPKMRYAICFPYGPVWQIKFCPSGGYFDDGSPESRLGLLAVTSLIGDVYLYALPIRANLNEEGNENYSILNLKPSTVLTYDLNKYKFIGEKSQQMTKITWSEAKGHSIFAAGYSSGLISIWKIDTKSILLLQRINDVRTILPVQIIKAHNNSISALSIFYADNSRYMMTGCKDRTSKFYDLQSVPVELTCSQLKSRITCGAWPLHWSGYFLSVDEGYALHRAGTSYVQPLDIGSKQTSMHILNSTACDMDFNDWLNSFIVVTDNGDIVGGYCKQLLFTFAEKDARKFRFIFGCTEVVDLKKEEKIILDCESSYPDKYGLIFCDILDPINSKQCPVDLLNSRRPPIEEYPLTQINQVRCNRNADAYKFYAIGYQAGFVRIRSLRQVK